MRFSHPREIAPASQAVSDSAVTGTALVPPRITIGVGFKRFTSFNTNYSLNGVLDTSATNVSQFPRTSQRGRRNR